MVKYIELSRIFYLLLLHTFCVSTPDRLTCGTVGSASSAGSHPIGSSSDTLTVSETSGGSDLSRTEYTPGETLYVALSGTHSQYAVELTNGAIFDSGSDCGGARKRNG